MKKIIITIIIGTMTFSLFAESLIIFDADKSLRSFTQVSKYKSIVKRVADKDIKAPGMQQSMLVETLKQDEGKGQYWYIFNGCSWDGKGGDTSALKSQPIEIEFYILPSEAMSLPDNKVATKYLDKTTVMRFCFGAGSRNNSIKLILRRSFFQFVDKAKNELQVRKDRTGKWIIISIQRDTTGKPIALKVKTSPKGKYENVPKTEYLFQVPKMPNWKYSNFIAIECWGKSPDNFGFNISRISLGKMTAAIL
jgi:hypothetical protein